MKAINKLTGEVIEYNADTPEEIMQIWQEVNETIKTYESIKDQLKKKVPEIVNDRGLYEQGDYQFRVSFVQRYTYDKAILRQNLDEDTLDLFLEPNKKAIDEYLKENLEDLGSVTTTIRNALVEKGKPYQVIKLERLTR
jgi:hypothetical protein